MTIQQALEAIREFDLRASYDAANAEYRVDFTRKDPRYIPVLPGHGSAFFTEEASIALSVAERMCDASWYLDPAAHRRHITFIHGL
ncbi:hypothetical protein Mpop_0199 [Methylorubrum populi BJ001]|jgi:hypothetical protein|uniref:Uncharacterized protein n=1 Tax=Methylorubrum populi (strain ATCC BAA-705 / NCIMB 13946 / BJ001) TaxID=441620 RepID=B1ZG55_METPB|nr:hypothetical protein [Methylorubrum populi]ACB78387.1 hypothetical protein Mpop_0199 [Methylorubrum populi BJ001]OAH28070.1 hypothetical protein AX289_24215 [Methylorubrum populi]PZP67825.1 MAG: hypothetical protein DI590_19280 [Methylorubrum populi]